MCPAAAPKRKAKWGRGRNCSLWRERQKKQHGDGGQLEVTRQWVWRRRRAWRR
jgi:hypothetical protein